MSEKDMTTTAARTTKKPALGRGLGSLLGGGFAEESSTASAPATPAASQVQEQKVTEKPAPTVVSEGTPITTPTASMVPRIPPEARIWQIDIDKVHPHEDQPRKAFEPEALKSLAASIKEKGILQPIVVRKRDETSFEIIAGERRWRAAQLAGLHRVPVILKTADDQNALELALIENIQREDLNPIEEAEAYKFIMDEYDLTQQELADRVGKDRASVANILRLLQLAPEVRQMVIAQEISLGQAKVLLSLPDPKTQKKLALKVCNDRLTVRATEKLVARLKDEEGHEDQILEKKDASHAVKAVADELQKLLGTKVSIDYSSGRGKIAIHFFSDEELNQVVERLRESCQK